MKASGICTVIDAVHIGRHDVLVMFDLTVEKAALGPGNASICNEDIETAVKFFHDLINYFFDVLLASNVYLVSSA